ncbi:11S globulin seed storage protein Ana o 2.0101-like [Prosopis cineraria]|uniref:11S globulin seed storage protein Ana o 2.0101-like n=1 Tax=Prosopis cineraria TaxID=364024 RepID=UPI0024107F62|nr:11S globulin seed storage protein Ana o 2.0101-like [Prosopis cineraria]
MGRASLALLLSLVCLVLMLASDGVAHRQKMRMERRPQVAECQLDRLESLKPAYRIESEGGLTESWNHSDKILRCAGVTLVRRTVQPKGLVLPSYTNAPQLLYYVRGSGIQGMTIFPSCPESFEEPEESERQEHREQHQKVHEIGEGDIIAIPAGIGYWFYNNGKTPLVVVILIDTSNADNQLDGKPRRFYLAGNPEDEHGQATDGERSGGRNLFSRIHEDLLSEIFGVRIETVTKMKGADDPRKNIVLVKEGLEVVRPDPGPRANGIEETICTLRVREHVGSAARADIYTPHAGRIATLNSIKLPILADLHLSAERGVLYKNGVYTPHWNLNANSIVYVTGGIGRIQVVNNEGKSVFDGEMEEGEVLVIPQNFVAVMQATGEEGFEWIAFKTAENAMINTLVGISSAIGALPVDVVAQIFRVSKEEAYKLKIGRDQTSLFSVTSPSSSK